MKTVLIVIDIDEKHMFKESNELFDRLKGYKCKLTMLPEEMKPVIQRQCKQDEPLYQEGWNDCLKEILQ